MAAALVPPVGDEVKAGEVPDVDLGREKEDLRGSARRGRDGCCCCDCMVDLVVCKNGAEK